MSQSDPLESKPPSRMRFPIWYRKHGMLFPSQLKNPKLTEYSNLVLPYNSLLHCADYEGAFTVGPPQTDTLIKNVGASKNFIFPVVEYPQGNKEVYIKLNKPYLPDYFAYVSENSSYLKAVKPIAEYNNILQLPIVVYGILKKLHNYRPLADAQLNHWQNHWYTVFNEMLKLSKQTDRQQFVEIDVPKTFPTLVGLKKGEDGITKPKLAVLKNPDMWLVSNLWNLIAQNGNDFIFTGFTVKDFEKINIIFKIDNLCTVVNLGTLLGFAYSQGASIKPNLLQRRFVKFLLNLSLGLTAENTSEFTSEFDSPEDKSEDKEEVDEFDDTESEENTEIFEDDETDSNIAIDSKHELEENIKLAKQKAEKSETEYSMKLVDVESDYEDDFVEEDLQLEKTLNELNDDSEEVTAYTAYEPKNDSSESIVEEEAMRYVKSGIMSVAGKDRLVKLVENSYTLDAPVKGYGKDIKEMMNISKESIEITKADTIPLKSHDILDESMTGSTLNKYTKNYVDNVMQRDIVNMVMNTQKGGLVVKDYQTERVTTINDDYMIHKVQIETIKGHTSTLSFKVPNVKPDGSFVSNGSKRKLRKQKGDIPIRKVSSDSVALTSYYSKMFVNRSDRKQFDLTGHLHRHVIVSSMEKRYGISNVKFGDVFDNTLKLPRLYTILAKKFTSFTVNGHELYFDYNNIEKHFGVKPTAKLIPLAKNITDGKLSLYLTNERIPKVLDSNQKFVANLDIFIGYIENSSPFEYAEVSLFGKSIPLVLILGYHLGFGNLLKTLGLKPKREAKGKRLSLSSEEYRIAFNDESLIFNRRMNPKGLMIINGLLRNKNYLRTISVYDLDDKSTYLDLAEDIKAPIKILKESKDMFNLWVDHITKTLLEEMKEPTDLVLLFIRAAELLTNDEHPDAMDARYMRDKGVERMAGLIYSELTKAIREYNSKPIYNQNKLTINPEAVWFAITTDQTQQLVEDSNPIHNLKENEVIVYSGAGGRSGQTMMASARKFHKSALGIVGENTVDSGDAGATIYNTANPRYNSVYGTINPVNDAKELGNAELMSTSFNMAPGAAIDD